MDAIHLPPGLTLPSAFGAPAAPLPAGQVIQALVLELIEGDIFRLQLPQATIDVRSSVPLTPGSTITLGAKGTGAGTRLAIYTNVPAGAAASGPAAAPNLAGRTPIGEAVAIARASTAQRAVTALDAKNNAPPAARVSAEPAQLGEAITSGPLTAARQSETPVRVIMPEQAVTEAIRSAAPRQAGLALLFADLAHVAQAGDDVQFSIPASVKAAASDVLSFRVPLDEQLTAGDVKQAFVRSGVLLEPKLVATRTDITPASTPSDDLKAALLIFRRVLKTWALVPQAAASSDAAPLSPEQATGLARAVATTLVAREAPHAANLSALPPPWRGAPLAAQAPASPSLAPDASQRDIADKLIGEADGALARQTLLQVASLPEQPDQPRAEATQRWNFEVPFATPQGTAIAQFEITRDGRALKSEPQARTWRARFSIDVEPMGPVHAMIALSGARTSVTLWAERATTAARLNEFAPRLSEALRAAELEPADFQARVGMPPAARQAAPGRFMDRAS